MSCCRTCIRKSIISFPFPYAIDAVRECVCGLYGTTWLKNIGCLLIFGAAALVIGLLVRKPFRD